MFDKNHDGHLTRAEIILGCRKNPDLAKLMGLPEHVGDQQRDVFEKIFQSMDEDDDREITLEEFMHYFGFIPRVEKN